MPGQSWVPSANSAPHAKHQAFAGRRRAVEDHGRWPAAATVPFAASLALGLWAAIIGLIRMLL